MQVYNDGPCELSEYDLDHILADLVEWVVYWYDLDWYDGSGQMVALRKDGQLEVLNLVHCSCYGPLDGWGGTLITVENFFRKAESIHDDDYSRLNGKVAELLGLPVRLLPDDNPDIFHEGL